MSVPLQASIPLALRLENEAGQPNITRLIENPGASPCGRTVNEFNFLREHAHLEESTVLFTSIIRAIHLHPDWTQLRAFFSKRYTKREMFSDRDLRKLTPPKDFTSSKDKSVTANFKTDPSLAGVAKDIKEQLAVAGRTVRSGIIGTDPQTAAIGPAIGLALGAGNFMDLIYRDSHIGNASSKAPTAEDWANLWGDIADWVYEYDSTSLEHFFLGTYTYKRGVTDSDRKSFRPGSKLPKGMLATDAVDAADTIHSAFKQLAAQPMEFYGMEWDFLELEASPALRDQFYARFGRRGADNDTTRRNLFVNLENQPEIRVPTMKQLHWCPVSLSGIDWENWVLSLRGGHVVVPHTVLEALWAVMFISQLPLRLEIVPLGSKLPYLRDSDTIYM
ncbi:hypothetical protein VHEMI02240 [[Torrubiella] hemipterigena]|uniref:Uncharacterized protein n=1 Tax=[Torrubiella] hemipterigena TaxID=1531966 RepID=A0A0A1SVB9_9HYPO|nr:hypothetical protein VHEMI02240 [[Torrubiella] hemipterigena]